MKLSDDVSRYHRPAQYESKRKRNCNTVDIICKKKVITCTIISNCLNKDLTSIIPIADTLEHVYISNVLLKLVE